MNISVMNSKDNWNIFSKNRNAIYGVAIISIMIFHFFEDIANSNLSGGGLGFFASCIMNITVRQSRQSGVARATCPD